MKIKIKKLPYDKVCALPAPRRRKPQKPSRFFRALLKIASASALKKTHFTCRQIGMEKLGADEPCLILMNHSSFIDLEIAVTVLYPRPLNIVCTSDGFVGKSGFMRRIGCIPTKKFVTDVALCRDMLYALKSLKSSVLMYPEASYSFDGTATPLPDSLGKCIKILGVPVVLIRTYGAFSHDPLYNSLQLRDVDVSADVEYLLSPADIAAMPTEDINALLSQRFTFDNFRWQQENRIRIAEAFRADGLNRVLYKCPHCLCEGSTVGKGKTLLCKNCGKEYELTEFGFIKALDGEAAFDHVPDWYRWEREEVRRELLENRYCLDIPVVIRMLVDTKCVYEVGRGRLHHDINGFHLTGCDGKLDVRVKPLASYSLYADYFWYETGDMICIGDKKALYYCFPEVAADVAAKTRLAVEELYTLTKTRQLPAADACCVEAGH